MQRSRFMNGIPYNQYAVERQPDDTYKVINHSNYANGSDNIYFTQRNEGRFVVVESRAPSGYYGDWTDVTNPGAAGSVLGKRAYAFEITKALDGQTLWLGNADYNADITTTNNGGTLIDTDEGIVTITFGNRATDKTYDTDPTGIANNEKSYTMHADADKMQNDRVLGSILLTKVDLDAARYLAAGSNGDTTLEGAVYDLYAADTIAHPDGVTGTVDYSKITDANGTPIWHTMPTDNLSGTPLSSPTAARIPITCPFCRKTDWLPLLPSRTGNLLFPTYIWGATTLSSVPQV